MAVDLWSTLPRPNSPKPSARSAGLFSREIAAVGTRPRHVTDPRHGQPAAAARDPCSDPKTGFLADQLDRSRLGGCWRHPRPPHPSMKPSFIRDPRVTGSGALFGAALVLGESRLVLPAVWDVVVAAPRLGATCFWHADGADLPRFAAVRDRWRLLLKRALRSSSKLTSLGMDCRPVP